MSIYYFSQIFYITKIYFGISYRFLHFFFYQNAYICAFLQFNRAKFVKKSKLVDQS